MNKTRFIRLALLPVLAGLAVTILVWRMGVFQPPPPEPVDLQEVVVAMEDVPARTVLEADMLGTMEMPAEFVSPLAVTHRAEAVGRVTAAPLAEGEIVLKNKLAADKSRLPLAFSVPPGRRAVTVGVTEVTGVAGSVEAGDRVDVVAAFDERVTGVYKSILLLEDLSVLAVDRHSQTANKAGNEEIYRTATLAATPQEATVLALAEEFGTVRLLLRPVLAERSQGRFDVAIDYMTDDSQDISQLVNRGQVRFRAMAVAVDAAVVERIAPGVGADPGGIVMSTAGETVLLELEQLAKGGRAVVLSETDLVTMDGRRVTWALEEEFPLTLEVENLQATSWQIYGVALELRPALYEEAFFDCEVAVRAGVMHTVEVERTQDGRPVDYPFVERRAADGELRVADGEVIVVAGLVGAQDILAAREGAVKFLPGALQGEILDGSRRLVFIVRLARDAR